MADWSKLPVVVLWMIAVRLFSAVELKHFRSICRSWRSSVSGVYRPLSSRPARPLIQVNPLIAVAAFTTQGDVEEIHGLDLGSFISPASFYRVTHSSHSHGWLIKSDVDINLGTFQFINPLSRHPYHHRCQSLNLLKFTFTEIREAYIVQNSIKENLSCAFKRVILVTLQGGDHFIGIGFDGKIRYWNGEIWTRIRINNQMAQFSDIIVYRGLVYALDSKGIVWWITCFSAIFRLEASLEEYITCRDMSFVECCGELYVVQRFHEENLRKRKVISMDDNANLGAGPKFYSVIHDNVGNEKCDLQVRRCPRTVGFKVYKLNENLLKWVEVKSLGGNAFMMATDTCFSVVAHEYYGCLPNAIYFNDEEDEIKVFQLDDDCMVTILADLFPSVYPSDL